MNPIQLKIEIAKLIVSLLVPLTVAILGYWFNRWLKAIELEKQRQNQLDQKERDKEIAEITRIYEPHIEFTILTNFHGPQKGFYIAEFVIFAHNKSLVQHKFKEIILRVRGIRRDAQPSLWKNHEPRLAFPDQLLETDIVPQNWNYIFVEPGVKQELSFITRIEESYGFVSAWAEFRYDKYTPHSIERLFAVDAHPSILKIIS